MSDPAAAWLGLAGRTAVVTGAGGGIGAGIAAALAQAGAYVVVLDRDAAAAGTVADGIRAAGGQATALRCEVSDPASVADAAHEAGSKAGPCGILVNNAGFHLPGHMADLTEEAWNAVLSVNLGGYFRCAQAFGTGMRAAGRGSIVHVASVSGHSPRGFSGAYSVSKAGVLMLSQQLAVEWGPAGIRSNVVSPGLIRTPMTEDFYTAPGVLAVRSALVPLRRIGAPADIADAALFLASDRAAYVTGAEIVVDGGFTRTIMNVIPRPGFDGRSSA